MSKPLICRIEDLEDWIDNFVDQDTDDQTLSFDIDTCTLTISEGNSVVVKCPIDKAEIAAAMADIEPCTGDVELTVMGDDCDPGAGDPGDPATSVSEIQVTGTGNATVTNVTYTVTSGSYGSFTLNGNDIAYTWDGTIDPDGNDITWLGDTIVVTAVIEAVCDDNGLTYVMYRDFKLGPCLGSGDDETLIPLYDANNPQGLAATCFAQLFGAELNSLLVHPVPCTRTAIYRWAEPVVPGVTNEIWDANAAPHTETAGIWTDTTNTDLFGMPGHVNGASDQTFVDPDFNLNSAASTTSSDQMRAYGWIYLDDPGFLRDNNQNNGEMGDVHLAQCGTSLVLGAGSNDESTGNTSVDRSILDSTAVNAGWVFVYARISDLSAFSGFDIEYSTDEASWSNLSDWQSDEPTIECMITTDSCDVPDGWSLCKPDPCIILPMGGGGPAPTLNVTTKTIYEEFYAAGSDNGTSQSWARNMTLTNLGVGHWRVTLIPAHPDGTDYHVSFSAQEPDADRDMPKITILEGTKTAAGFEYKVTFDDNGQAQDGADNNLHSVGINAPCEVVSAASLD